MPLLQRISADRDPTTFIARAAAIRTRNGDRLDVRFKRNQPRDGMISLGVVGGFERAFATLDFKAGQANFGHSDWTRARPQKVKLPPMPRSGEQVLSFEKLEGSGNLVKFAHVTVRLNGKILWQEKDLNLLEEIAFFLTGRDVTMLGLEHHGSPRPLNRRLHLGGWQVINSNCLETNTQSILAGIRAAAQTGVQLLVTPETSLTGLYPTQRVTRDRAAIDQAEKLIQKTLGKTKNAPFLVMGLPVWRREAGHRRRETRFNASRVYTPEGQLMATHVKTHSCEPDFWHGYRLQEFDVHGVPVCMHICHDGRYPELSTLPMMFGARVILHPANGGTVGGSIDAFEALAAQSTRTTHAFYIHVNGGGGSFIAGPEKVNTLITASAECSRQTGSFPSVNTPQACLIHADIDTDLAYGYWPRRSYRASEAAAAAYRQLYQAMGGSLLEA